MIKETKSKPVCPKPIHPELGDYLELLRNVVPVGGKCLAKKELCRLISMSPKTYNKVKGAQV